MLLVVLSEDDHAVRTEGALVAFQPLLLGAVHDANVLQQLVAVLQADRADRAGEPSVFRAVHDADMF